MKSKEEESARHRAYYEKRSIESKIYYRAKTRSNFKQIDFDIEISDIVVPTHCPVLGLKLSHNNAVGGSHDSPSLDRINPKKGYVKGNIRVISMRANVLKSNGSLDEMRLIVQDLERIDGVVPNG